MGYMASFVSSSLVLDHLLFLNDSGHLNEKRDLLLLFLIPFSFTLSRGAYRNMALSSLPCSRFILHSANALVLVSVKVLEASKFPDINIVSFDWLTTSINSQIRSDESQFSFDQRGSDQDDATSSINPKPSKENDSKGKGKKRPRSPTPVEEDSSDIDETGEPSPKKRHKDVQKAKSGSLLIPVDETCPLAGKTVFAGRNHDD